MITLLILALVLSFVVGVIGIIFEILFHPIRSLKTLIKFSFLVFIVLLIASIYQ